MYKKIITIFVLILLNESCKTKDSIFTTNNETIFVLANKNNGNYFTKKKFDSHKSQKKQSYIYTYYFSDNPNKFINKIELVYKEYESFDDFKMNKPTPYFEVNKKFLKNNEKNIYDVKKLREIGYIESQKMIKMAKHIFLIEYNVNEKDKISVKKTSYFEIGEL